MVVLFALALRLPGLGRPLVGNFATKNVLYAMMARNFAQGEASPWYPMLDCLTESGPALYMVDFPLSAYLTGCLWRVGGGSLDVWGRFMSAVFYSAAVGWLFLLVDAWHTRRSAVAAALALALAPIGIAYGQNFMEQSSLVLLTIATLDTWRRWLLTGRSRWLAASVVAAALVVLTKIYMAVLLLPLLAAWRAQWRVAASPHSGRQEHAARDHERVALHGADLDTARNASPGALRRRSAAFGLAMLALAMLPPAAWYTHATRASAPQSALAERMFYSTRQNAASYRPPDPLLASPRFYVGIARDGFTVVLAPLAGVLALVGLGSLGARRHAAWIAAMLLLVAALPRKFDQLNYYYMALLPLGAVLAGLGYDTLAAFAARQRAWPRGWLPAVALTLALAGSLRYALKPAFYTPTEDRSVVAAAAAARSLLAADEPVVTMHGATIDLLYYCARRGWAVPPDAPDLAATLDRCRAAGARRLVVTSLAELDRLADPHALDGLEVEVAGDDFRIYRLDSSRDHQPSLVRRSR